MVDKLMYIPNDETENYPLQLVVQYLDTFLNEPTKQNSIKIPKVFKPKNKKTLI